MLIIINPTETDEGNRARVSQYEAGIRVPSLVEIYNYARFAGISVETLLNDALDLPAAMQQSNSGSTNDEQARSETDAKDFETTKKSDHSLNTEDIPPVETPSELQETALTGAQTSQPSPTESDMDDKNPASSAATYLIRISEEISDDGKAVFLKMLGALPFNKMGRITPEKFVEQALAAGLDDFHAQHSESALARRMQLLFGDETID